MSVRGAIYECGEWQVDIARRELRARGLAVPIGGRAFEIVEVLVQAAGELVTKDDLMARVWPGSIVEENTLQVHISAVRRAFGADRGMLKTTMGRGYRLDGTWRIRRENASAGPAIGETTPTPAQGFQSNLPAALSDVIGRDAAMRELQDLLSAYRMVTLTGPGGIGKTALALETARRLFPAFAGDGWLVELGSLSDPALVPTAVAGTVGLKLGADISAEAVARGLGGKRLLLVLDNCEHVVDAAAALAETIMRLCPRTTILATSREVLRIAGEHVYRVPPLDVPPEHHEMPDSLLDHSAVRLFVARARASHGTFSPQGDELATIATVCRQLDGIPLAIEFAAARAATIGMAQVAAHLDDRFGLLIGGRRTALPRHQTLRATLDWSYELLPEPERRLLRHLAIFNGGFTLAAATAVLYGGPGNVSAITAPTITDGISNLVSKSLVALDTSASTGHWRLLETIRVYALEKLGEHGEAGRAARRHAEYFRDLVSPGAVILPLQPGIEEMARHAGEISNVRAALDWSFSRDGDAGVGIALTVAYIPVWTYLELLVERGERTEAALDRLAPDLDIDPSLSIQLHLGLGLSLTHMMRSAGRCRELLAKALAGAQRADDVRVQAVIFWALWVVHLNAGECRAAHAVALQFARNAERTGEPALALMAERLVGCALHFGNDQVTACRHFQHLLESYVPPKDPLYRAWLQFDQRAVTHAMLARALMFRGLVDQAAAQARASVEAAKDQIPSVFEALRLGTFPVSLMSGDFAAAERAVRTLLERTANGQTPFWADTARCLEGRLWIERGDFETGTRMLRTALDTCERSGWTVWYPESLGTLAKGLAGLGRLPEALETLERALAFAEDGGETYSVAELLRLKGELTLQQGEDDAGAAAEDCFGQALDLAREQGALFWELRAAVSLARLRLRQKRHELARQTLAPVYARFTEGLDTTDLIAARDLLEELTPQRV